MRLLACRFDDLDEPDGTPFALGDQQFAPIRIALQFDIPIVKPAAADSGNDMRCAVPTAQKFDVILCCRP